MSSGASKLLFVVEDTFAITGRGLVLVPGADLGITPQQPVAVELRRPNGSAVIVSTLVQVPTICGPATGHHRPALHHLIIANLSKGEVSTGTEIWSNPSS